MLSERQQLSIDHLNFKVVHSPKEIIEWSTNNIHTHRRNTKRKTGAHAGRRHPKKYYQEIIEHYLPLLNES